MLGRCFHVLTYGARKILLALSSFESQCTDSWARGSIDHGSSFKQGLTGVPMAYKKKVKHINPLGSEMRALLNLSSCP